MNKFSAHGKPFDADTFRSQGKLIVSGEHAAVYGQPAVVTSISVSVSVGISEDGELDEFLENIQRIFSEKTGVRIIQPHKFLIKSELPVGSGLGSSAAIAYACFQALADTYELTFSKDDYIELVQESEKYMHGSPSGIDTYAVVHGGLFSFQKTSTKPIIQQIKTEMKLQALLINSGKPAETTKEMISLVAQHIQAKPELANVIEEIGSIAKTITSNFNQGKFDYNLVKQNQAHLVALGVSSPEANAIISTVEQAGGVAKLTGAGGKTGGSGMILTFHPDENELQKLAEHFKESAYMITFPGE